jgi:hypothetical protein
MAKATQRYRVETIHKISGGWDEEGEHTLTFDPTAPRTVAKALREAGILPRGSRVSEVRYSPAIGVVGGYAVFPANRIGCMTHCVRLAIVPSFAYPAPPRGHV